MITFEQVSKVYPDGTVAVEDLSLELETGKITVFVGPSGCGKTTSLRMINRMITPTSGKILIDGKNVAEQDDADLRRSIGYVIQHAGLFPHRTVLDNIITVPSLVGTSRKEARKRALELMERVGLSTSFAKRYPVQLSGGQQQRVGVARALAADPPVMLMDEPFSAVDPIVREGLQGEFLRLQAELGKTIAMVTHDIDEAVKLGDTVAVFREGGELAQVASPRELLRNPADRFVADFVGQDRGFRSLSFDASDGLVLESPELPQSGYRLLTDESGAPLGWSRSAEAAEPELILSGRFRVGESLRNITDLAIVSPIGVAVRVDENGRADGVISHESLARQLRELRSPTGNPT